MPLAKWSTRSDLPGRLRLAHPRIRVRAAAERVAAALDPISGVQLFELNTRTGRLLIHYDPAAIVRDEILSAVEHTLPSERPQPQRRRVQSDDVPARPWKHLQLSTSSFALTLCGISVFVPSLASAAIVITLISSVHILRSAAHSLFVERRTRVDILDAAVVLLSLGFRKTPAAALMVWIVDVGDTLLEASSNSTRDALSRIFGEQVRHTWILVDGVEVECLVDRLEEGDIVVVRAGEQIPVDGVIVEGEAMVDQSALTGEAAPVERMQTERVMAMTVVLAGRILVQVTAVGENTSAGKMVRIIEQALEHQSEIALISEEFADLMVVPTLGLGAVGFGTTGASSMLAIINADFGTGIRIAGPVALLTSLSVAARNGILIKNGRILESIHTLDAIVFDKTGTLTEEVPQVACITCWTEGLTERELLAWVVAAEAEFNHPIAQALRAEAARQDVSIPVATDSRYHVGLGAEVELVQGRRKVGSRRYMEREGIGLAARSRPTEQRSASSTVYVALNSTLIGQIELSVRARPEARRIIQTLREQRGIKHLYLISGDHEEATAALAQELGFDTYFHSVLPEQKAEYVANLQAQGLRVGMVGDGINDSAALSRADCSISLQGASDIAVDMADVVFLDGNLAKFEMLFEISENLTNNVRTSFALIAIPNAILITGALTGIFGLGSSLVLNNLFNVVASANGTLDQNRQQPPRQTTPDPGPPLLTEQHA